MSRWTFVVALASSFWGSSFAQEARLPINGEQEEGRLYNPRQPDHFETFWKKARKAINKPEASLENPYRMIEHLAKSHADALDSMDAMISIHRDKQVAQHFTHGGVTTVAPALSLSLDVDHSLVRYLRNHLDSWQVCTSISMGAGTTLILDASTVECIRFGSDSVLPPLSLIEINVEKRRLAIVPCHYSAWLEISVQSDAAEVVAVPRPVPAELQKMSIFTIPADESGAELNITAVPTEYRADGIVQMRVLDLPDLRVNAESSFSIWTIPVDSEVEDYDNPRASEEEAVLATKGLPACTEEGVEDSERPQCKPENDYPWTVEKYALGITHVVRVPYDRFLSIFCFARLFF
jgi:hypothetical protein